MMKPVFTMQFLIFLSLWLPKYCDATIPPPLPIPLQSAKKRNVIEPDAPTAASASAPT